MLVSLSCTHSMGEANGSICGSMFNSWEFVGLLYVTISIKTCAIICISKKRLMHRL